MRALPKPTKLTVRYLRSVTFRLAVFLFVAALFLRAPDWLDFTAGKPLTVPLVLLWLAVACSMLAQLNPKSALTAGCMKQYPNRFDPVANYSRQSLKEAVRQQNRGAVKVAAVWLAGNLVFGILYWRRTIGVAELVLLCAFYYLSDLICVLFFCPFQTFLMGNRCCVNCRIFAWGSWMMATPMAFVPHWFSWSLVGLGLVVLVVWEVRFRRYPERFWFGSNKLLQCAHCQEQLCRYKFPRSPRFRG